MHFNEIVPLAILIGFAYAHASTAWRFALFGGALAALVCLLDERQKKRDANERNNGCLRGWYVVAPGTDRGYRAPISELHDLWSDMCATPLHADDIHVDAKSLTLHFSSGMRYGAAYMVNNRAGDVAHVAMLISCSRGPMFLVSIGHQITVPKTTRRIVWHFLKPGPGWGRRFRAEKAGEHGNRHAEMS